MGLFDKKYCSICGEKIGLFGNRKLEDVNLCKDCAKKLSPWFSDRRNSTVAEIKEQLEYRERNKEDVARFHTTRTLGSSTRILLDEDAQKFMVTYARNIQDANPDVLWFPTVAEALSAIRAAFTAGTAVLVKASHAMHFTDIVKDLESTE